MAELEKEKITLSEGISFWQANKSWLVPMVAAIGGMLGGANVDKVGGLLPTDPQIPAIVKAVNDHEVRIVKLEGGTTATLPVPDSKKNDGSQGGVIKIE